MIMINENKKLSRHRKRRIEQKFKLDDKMKSLLNKIKTEKKKKNKNFDKIEELEIELVKIKYDKNPKNLQSELKDLNKVQVVTDFFMRINKKYYMNILVNLKW